jgi:hypothetical protein
LAPIVHLYDDSRYPPYLLFGSRIKAIAGARRPPAHEAKFDNLRRQYG